MASCFFLIRNSVDMYKITKTVIFSRACDFGFSMSPRDMYYQFYKNAPIVYIGLNWTISQMSLIPRAPQSGAKKERIYTPGLRSWLFANWVWFWS